MNTFENKFVLKKETSWYLAFFLVPFSVVAIVLSVFTTYGQIGSYFLNDKILFPNKIPELWTAVIVLWLVAFVAINLLLWQLIGREIILFRENGLELLKWNGLIKRPMRFDYSEIEKFEKDEDKETPYWIKYWGLGGGKLIIKYSSSKIRFGQDLSVKDSSSLMNKLNQELQKRKI